VFWQVLAHLQQSFPGFQPGTTRGLAARFRRSIHVVDATVIQLVASCLDWAKHKRRKAAAKCHLRLSLRSLLPSFVVLGSARESELARARELCAGLRAGEIVRFDRGYHELTHLWDLTGRGVFFVTRPRTHLLFKVVKRRRRTDPKILADEEIVRTGRHSRQDYPERMRRVRALVRIEGEEREMVFVTNNFAWAATSIAELYRCRWQIEAFFKQLKQTLQLADFLGHNANAVQGQLWTALLVYVLLRFQTWRSRWPHSFARLFTLLRAALWHRHDLGQLLRRYGTPTVRHRAWNAISSGGCPVSPRNSWDRTATLLRSHHKLPPENLASPLAGSAAVLPRNACRAGGFFTPYGMTVVGNRRSAKPTAISLFGQALNDFFDFHPDGLARRAVGLEGDEAVAVLVVDRPERGAIGLGEGQRVDAIAGEEAELTLADVGRECGQRLLAAKQKHQPVGVALVGFFRDHREEVQIGGGDDVARFFAGLAHGALKRRLAERGLELAADGAPRAEVRRLGPQHEQVFTGGVFEEDEDGDLVGEGSGHGETFQIPRAKLQRNLPLQSLPPGAGWRAVAGESGAGCRVLAPCARSANANGGRFG
jgi:hypothetical protein